MRCSQGKLTKCKETLSRLPLLSDSLSNVGSDGSTLRWSTSGSAVLSAFGGPWIDYRQPSTKLMSVRCKEAGEKRWEFSHTDSSHATLLAFDFNAEESDSRLPPRLASREPGIGRVVTMLWPASSSSTRLLLRDTVFVFFDKRVHVISAPHQSDGRRFHGRRSYSITNVSPSGSEYYRTWGRH